LRISGLRTPGETGARRREPAFAIARWQADPDARNHQRLLGFAREVVRGVYKLSGRLLLALDIEKVVDIGDLGRPKSNREF